jgi:hypothetical protein
VDLLSNLFSSLLSLQENKVASLEHANFKASSLTNFGQLDKTWAEFSTLDVGVRLHRSVHAYHQNSPT